MTNSYLYQPSGQSTPQVGDMAFFMAPYFGYRILQGNITSYEASVFDTEETGIDVEIVCEQDPEPFVVPDTECFPSKKALLEHLAGEEYIITPKNNE